MKIQRLLIALTVINLGLLMFLLAQIRSVEVNGFAPVLRGRALEIVDDQGRVRASIKVLPPDQAGTMPDGETPSETVILRLIDRNGRPAVKLAMSERSAGLGLVGASDATHIVVKAGTDSSLKLASKDGRQQLIKP